MNVDPKQACDVCGGGLDAEYPRGCTVKFECLICNQSFDRGDRLVAHSAGHTGVKPFFCTSCPRTFARASRLSEHRSKFHASEFEQQHP
jgi:hypothetical protein